MKNISEMLVNESTTIIDTLSVIDTNSKGIAVVIDSKGKLLGTITDGDIRRAIIQGKSVKENIEDIYNKTCKYALKKDITKGLLNSLKVLKIKFLPIVDEDMIFIDYLEVDDMLTNVELVKDNPVLIMAGGMGTRLKPLTDEIPKPMLLVGGKPILETIIEQFRSQGFTNIYISVNYKSEIIEDYFRDGKDFGVSITYIKESKRMGTAGAIKLAEKYLDKPFFVVNGDILTKVNYKRLLEYHEENEFVMTIGCRNFEMQIPYGVLNINDICVTSLEEKPIVSYFISGGIYLLNTKTLEYIPQDEYFDITELINNIIKDKERIGSFPIQEYWMDIGHLNDYYKANEDIKKYF
jgi:dTDP-glucose pyrophosphorylase